MDQENSMRPVRKAAHAVLDSVWLIAIARVLVPVMLSALLGTVGFYERTMATAVVDVTQRLSILERERVQGRIEIIGRIEHLEQHDREDTASNLAIVREIGEVKTDVATVKTGQDFVRQSLDRIERAMGGGGRPNGGR